MNQNRKQILQEIDVIINTHCEPCVLIDGDGNEIKVKTNSTCSAHNCSHLIKLQNLGEMLSDLTINGRKTRKSEKINKEVVQNMTKLSKWQQQGLTVDKYQQMKREGKTDREVCRKFGIDHNEMHRFKTENELVKRRNEEKAAATPVLHEKDQTPASKAPVVKLKPEFEEKAKMNAENELEKAKSDLHEAQLKIAHFKGIANQATKELELKDEHIEELESEVISLKEQQGSLSATDDDYELMKRKQVELETELEVMKTAQKELLAENSELLKKLKNAQSFEQDGAPQEEANAYVDMYNEQVIEVENLHERIEDLEYANDQLMTENSDLKLELQRMKDLNFLNLEQFMAAYSENEMNKREIRNLERKADQSNPINQLIDKEHIA